MRESEQTQNGLQVEGEGEKAYLTFRSTKNIAGWPCLPPNQGGKGKTSPV